MSVLDSILSIIAPYHCLGCGFEGGLICGECQKSIRLADGVCCRCRKRSPHGKTCVGCLPAPLRSVQSIAVYEGLSKRLVKALKFDGAQAAAREMAQMSRCLDFAPDALIVHAPTASRRIRSRGYDQARLFARCLAREHGLEYRNVLRRSGQAHQVGSSRTLRLEQLHDAYWVARPRDVHGRRIILVDDVMTTGATLQNAAQALLGAGALSVDGIVFARA